MMSKEQLAGHLCQQCSCLVIFGMPPGTEFGIDVNFWNIGERFQGVKMIPPGLHFIYYSAVNRHGDTAPRTGFFHIFKAREVLVKHYDKTKEEFKEEDPSPEEVERVRSNLQELDRFLGPYPIDSWSKWVSLSQYIKKKDIDRVTPLSGLINSVPELIPLAGFRSSRSDRQKHNPTSSNTSSHPSTSSLQNPSPTSPTTSQNPCPTSSNPANTSQPHTTLPNPSQPNQTTPNSSQPQPTLPNHSQPIQTPSQPHTTLPNLTQSSPNSSQPIQTPSQPHVTPSLPEMVQREGTAFRFTKPPKRRYREGATPSEVTQGSLDSTYCVNDMLARLESPEHLLAELQVSFISFLVGQVWEGWEHWRELIMLICQAEALVTEIPDFFYKMLSVLHYQVSEIPEDLFVDVVESNNFLASSLTTLFANINDNASFLPQNLLIKAKGFKDHLTAKFEWDLTLEDEGEYAPVVVEI